MGEEIIISGYRVEGPLIQSFRAPALKLQRKRKGGAFKSKQLAQYYYQPKIYSYEKQNQII